MEFEMEKTETPNRYTCNEYREEMLLLSLRRQLAAPGLDRAQRETLLKEIARVEKQMGLD
jgi:hypothetical protein